MDPKACFLAYVNASFAEKHLYWDDLADWFQRGGFGFEAQTLDGKLCVVERVTHTRKCHVRFLNNRRAVLPEHWIMLRGES